jgi:hypothetical protein
MAALVTCCTNAMTWFAILHARLREIDKNARSDLGKLVALLLCVPCFKLSHLFFKFAYALNQRRLLRLRGPS